MQQKQNTRSRLTKHYFLCSVAALIEMAATLESRRSTKLVNHRVSDISWLICSLRVKTGMQRQFAHAYKGSRQ